MATTTITTFDAKGAKLAEQTIDVPAEVTNRQTLTDAATAALAANRTFAAIASPTNAQVAAQVKALTRQNTALIRLLLNQLDGTD